MVWNFPRGSIKLNEINFLLVVEGFDAGFVSTKIIYKLYMNTA